MFATKFLDKYNFLKLLLCFLSVPFADAGKWTGEMLRQLGSLVKGLDLNDIKKLGKEAFEEAVGAWGQFVDVDMETLEALAEKAKQVRRHFRCRFSCIMGINVCENLY